MTEHRSAFEFVLAQTGLLTFPPAIEFHLDLLVHILGQVENILLLRLFLFFARRTASAPASIVTTPSSSLVTTTTTSKMASFRHDASIGFELKGHQYEL